MQRPYDSESRAGAIVLASEAGRKLRDLVGTYNMFPSRIVCSPSSYTASGWSLRAAFTRQEKRSAILFCGWAAKRSGRTCIMRRTETAWVVSMPLPCAPPESWGGPTQW